MRCFYERAIFPRRYLESGFTIKISAFVTHYCVTNCVGKEWWESALAELALANRRCACVNDIWQRASARRRLTYRKSAREQERGREPSVACANATCNMQHATCRGAPLTNRAAAGSR